MYIVDSNFFIQAHRSYYPFDVFPSFWQKVKSLAEDGKITCIDKVKDELYHNEDALKNWCAGNLPDSFFKESANDRVLNEYSKVVSWAAGRSNHYLQEALNEFLSADEADAWLVSHAMCDSCTIVTHEKSNPSQRNKIKIPEVCRNFNIPYIDTIGLFRTLGERF